MSCSHILIMCFQASTVTATVEEGAFKSNDRYGSARVTQLMNSKSPNNFRWSIKLGSSTWTCVGIASNSNRKNDFLGRTDDNAIVFTNSYGDIFDGKIESKLVNAKPGDVIHFRFQPKSMKFSISLSKFRYVADIKADVNYYPAIQGHSGSSAYLIEPWGVG